MRIKALLCAAAVAAGAVSAMAQSNVYSLNIVGYVNVPINNGYTLIANPLDNGTNTLSSLFPNAGFGDSVFQYVAGAFVSSSYFGSWTPTDLTVVPGGGIFYQTGTPFTNTFVGNVLTGTLTNHIGTGYSLISSQVPVSDTLDNLGLPGDIGDVAFFYRGGSYTSESYFGSWGTLAPAVGEAFWIQTGVAKDWVRTFNP